jgi:hypothetical protein
MPSLDENATDSESPQASDTVIIVCSPSFLIADTRHRCVSCSLCSGCFAPCPLTERHSSPNAWRSASSHFEFMRVIPRPRLDLRDRLF